MKCPYCGAELLDDSLFCSECGTKVNIPQKQYCTECGAELDEGAKFCSECGAKTELYFNQEIERSNRSSDDIDPLSEYDVYSDESGDESFSYEQTEILEETTEDEEYGEHIFNQDEAIYDKLADTPPMTNSFPNPPKKKGNPVPIIALIIVAAIIILFTSKSLNNGGTSSNNYDSTGSGTSNKITVVDVVNMTLEDAEKALQAEGFKNITSNVDSNEDRTKWTVVKQSVKKGKSIHPDDKIELTCALQCKLFIDVFSDTNLIFSKYDITISLDEKELGSVSNGEEFTCLTDVLSGSHELEFCKTGDTSPSSSKDITVSSDMTYTCNLAHSGDSIDIKNENTINDISGAALEVIDVKGIVLSDAITKLSNIGFTNIREEPYSSIWNKDNWIVTKQNVDPGTVLDKSEYIQLDCISLNDYFNDTYVGKNISEIQNLANASNISLRFENESGEDINEKVSTMDSKTKNDWIASEARQYGGADKTAVVTIEYSGEDVESTESKNTPEVESTESSENESDLKEDTPETERSNEETGPDESNDKESSSTEIPMPILTGSNVDDAQKKAEQFGLKAMFDDDDFGHGTKYRTLTRDEWGMFLNMVYSVDTKELLMGSIVTNASVSPDEQLSFIKEIAPYLCPSESKDQVAEWVNANIGNTAEETINGTLYQLEFGAVDNALYYAGQRNWEDWLLSQDSSN